MDLLDALIASQALRIAPPGEVFWYTSGTLGPYYINTENLYGGPEKAKELLDFIDSDSRSPDFHGGLCDRVRQRLDEDEAFRHVIEAMIAELRSCEGFDEVHCISGGERRDWFFSLPVALTLGRPHLYIHKDHSMQWAESGRVKPVDDLAGRRTAHCADLVTEASSYARDWIPAIRDADGQMQMSVNVVDRAQGGMDVITGAGVDGRALLRVDGAMFDQLRDRGHIDDGQHAILSAYFTDPTAAMRRFLDEHPDFLPQALASKDRRTVERAKLLVESDPYGLKD